MIGIGFLLAGILLPICLQSNQDDNRELKGNRLALTSGWWLVVMLWICGFGSFLLGLFINECIVKPRREARLRLEEEEEEEAAEEEAQAMSAALATTTASAAEANRGRGYDNSDGSDRRILGVDPVRSVRSLSSRQAAERHRTLLQRMAANQLLAARRAAGPTVRRLTSDVLMRSPASSLSRNQLQQDRNSRLLFQLQQLQLQQQQQQQQQQSYTRFLPLQPNQRHHPYASPSPVSSVLPQWSGYEGNLRDRIFEPVAMMDGAPSIGQIGAPLIGQIGTMQNSPLQRGAAPEEERDGGGAAEEYRAAAPAGVPLEGDATGEDGGSGAVEYCNVSPGDLGGILVGGRGGGGGRGTPVGGGGEGEVGAVPVGRVTPLRRAPQPDLASIEPRFPPFFPRSPSSSTSSTLRSGEIALDGRMTSLRSSGGDMAAVDGLGGGLSGGLGGGLNGGLSGGPSGGLSGGLSGGPSGGLIGRETNAMRILNDMNAGRGQSSADVGGRGLLGVGGRRSLGVGGRSSMLGVAESNGVDGYFVDAISATARRRLSGASQLGSFDAATIAAPMTVPGAISTEHSSLPVYAFPPSYEEAMMVACPPRMSAVPVAASSSSSSRRRRSASPPPDYDLVVKETVTMATRKK